MVDAGGQFFFVMRHHDKCLAGLGAIFIYDILGQLLTLQVQSMHGFVKDEQVGVLDKGPAYESQSLFTAG